MKNCISMLVATVNKTVEDGFKEFATSCMVKSLSEKTIEYYEMRMGKFYAYLNWCDITATADLNQSVINDFILHMKESGRVNDISINTTLRGTRAIA